MAHRKYARISPGELLMKITEAIFAIIDSETTGLERDKGDELVELAACYWRYEPGLIGQPLDMLVDPGRDIPITASAVHHLTARDVYKEPTAGVALDLLDMYIGSETICVAHNAQFDRPFLPVLDDRRWICAQRLAQHLFPDAPAYKNQVLRYMFGGIDLDLEGRAPHRAMADVIVTAFNLKHTLAEYLKSHADDVDELIAFSASPILFRRILFGKHAGELFSDIPKSYLRWMLEADFDDDIKYSARVALDGSQRLFGAA
jgi:exodeoxyribonuclease X